MVESESEERNYQNHFLSRRVQIETSPDEMNESKLRPMFQINYVSSVEMFRETSTWNLLPLCFLKRHQNSLKSFGFQLIFSLLSEKQLKAFHRTSREQDVSLLVV